MASERDGVSTYNSRSQSSFTQLITVCTSAGIGMGDGWGVVEGREGERERRERERESEA